MLNKKELLRFILKARTQTYAGDKGKVLPTFKGSKQLEFRQDNWFYGDVYYMGNNIFMGLEVIHFKEKPVWSMSYYGNYKGMTEKEIDEILKKALLVKWQEARLWKKVEWNKGNFKYICSPDFKGSIDEMAGLEQIFKLKEEVYRFFYAGGIIC